MHLHHLAKLGWSNCVGIRCHWLNDDDMDVSTLGKAIRNDRTEEFNVDLRYRAACDRGFSGSGYWMTPDKFYCDQPSCHGNEIWDKIGYNSTYIRDTRRSLRIKGGFWGRAIEWRLTNSTATNPRCHGNEIWDKIGYNSTYIRDSPEIIAYSRGFTGSGYWMTPDKFYCDQPQLPWQRNLGQNRL